MEQGRKYIQTTTHAIKLEQNCMRLGPFSPKHGRCVRREVGKYETVEKN
ncbi:unnamed protein product [Callosobruchus maculatus]|uniref:Uncharacterized protein n=1 Tax=Callosobruchus maculatus TaxID=64391 RepID=A0A653D671_CALMS|nr:unnamed protein product [Callosobruchus maculatus]